MDFSSKFFISGCIFCIINSFYNPASQRNYAKATSANNFERVSVPKASAVRKYAITPAACHLSTVSQTAQDTTAGSYPSGLAIQYLFGLEKSPGSRPAGNGGRLAPPRIQALLEMEVPAGRAAVHRLAADQAHSTHAKREPNLVGPTDSGRTGQARTYRQ